MQPKEVSQAVPDFPGLDRATILKPETQKPQRDRCGGSNGSRHPLQRPADPRRGAPPGRLRRLGTCAGPEKWWCLSVATR